MSARAALVALLGGLLTTSGCSFVFASGPPSEQEVRAAPRYETPQCTATVALPALDGLLGLATLLATVQAVSSYEFDPNNDHSWNKTDLKIVGTAAVAVFAVSAIYGAVQVTRCKTYLDSFAPRAPRRARSTPQPQPSIEPSGP
jgi:hypothetical protein